MTEYPSDLNNATTIQSPTNLVWILGRILVNGPDDVQNVRNIQDTITLTSVTQNTTSILGNGDYIPNCR